MFKRNKPQWEMYRLARLTPEHLTFIRAYGDRHIRQDTYEFYEQVIARNRRRMLVIYEARGKDDILIGFSVSYLPEYGVPCEYAIHVVHPDYRNHGIGGMLFGEMVRAVRRAGGKPRAVVHKKNLPSQRAIKKSLRKKEVDGEAFIYA